MKSHTLLRFLYSAISLLTTLDPIHATTLHPPRGLQAMSNVQGSLNPGYVPNSGISNSSSPSPLIINQSNSGQIGISNPNWHEKIKSYLSVEVTSLPGLQPFVNDLNHDWGTSSTTSKTQSSIQKTSNSITKTCDNHGYMFVTATSLVTLSTLYVQLQSLQTQCHQKGYTKTSSAIQTTITQVSKTMYSVIKLTSSSDVDQCTVVPSQSSYCGTLQSNLDNLNSCMSTVETCLNQEHTTTTTTTSTTTTTKTATTQSDSQDGCGDFQPWGNYAGFAGSANNMTGASSNVQNQNSNCGAQRDVTNIMGLCKEGFQVAQVGCQGVTSSVPSQGPPGIHHVYNTPQLQQSVTKFVPKACNTLSQWIGNPSSVYDNNSGSPNGAMTSPQGGSDPNQPITGVPSMLPSGYGIDNGSPQPPIDPTSATCPTVLIPIKLALSFGIVSIIYLFMVFNP